MEKLTTRLRAYARRLQIDELTLAFLTLYVVTRDRTFAWRNTFGQSSKSKNSAQSAHNKLQADNARAFISELGGVMTMNMQMYLTNTGRPVPDLKTINKIMSVELYDEKTGSFTFNNFDRVERFTNYMSELIDKVDDKNRIRLDDKMADDKNDTDSMSCETSELDKLLKNVKVNNNEIELSPDMSREEYIKYLIQEQAKTTNQKDKNSFTLKISELMAFRQDKSDVLKPVIYLPYRKDLNL